LLAGTDRPEANIAVQGITSGRAEEHGLIYKVGAIDAILALEKHNAEAAVWWREHAPHLLQPGRLLAFSAVVCELLPLRKS